MPEFTITTRLILAILTTYRLARMVAKDDGPLYFFEHIRQVVKEKADKEVYNLGKWHSLYDGITCCYCLGVWVSLPLFLFVIYPTHLSDLFILLTAISGAQAWLWGMVDKK